MPSIASQPRLINDAPLRRLLAQFEQEAELFGGRGDGTMVANLTGVRKSSRVEAVRPDAPRSDDE